MAVVSRAQDSMREMMMEVLGSIPVFKALLSSAEGAGSSTN